MGFDAQAIVKDGRLVLDGLPFEDGSAVRVAVTPVDEIDRRRPEDLTAEEWIDRMRRVAKSIHARHPNTPVLTDGEMSRESMYEDRCL